VLIFLDTEFTSLEQRCPSLISLALVNEHGDYFYAELPQESYIYRASDWVRCNVVPWLWGGSYELGEAELSDKLVAWIEEIDDRVMVCTDSPDYDFEFLKKAILGNPWPRNLAKTCLRFDSYAMGVNRQSWLAGVMEAYHKEASAFRPEHHALHDAQSLRVGFMAALEAGWRPPQP
jgi:hypothetical protein